ncbi:Glutamate receptor ionotropic, NMDA 2A [Dirofilaria immitis]
MLSRIQKIFHRRTIDRAKKETALPIYLYIFCPSVRLLPTTLLFAIIALFFVVFGQFDRLWYLANLIGHYVPYGTKHPINRLDWLSFRLS